jgi:MFS family permease
MALGCAAYIPYGWALQSHTSLAVPLILQFIIGFCFIASLNTLNTLLVDLFPDRAATAAAACNLVRCWLGAIGAAVIDQMLTGMGWGWTFFFLGFCMAVAMALLWVEWVYGMGWRQTRLDGIERKKAERAAALADAEAQVDVKNDPGQGVNVEVDERDK